MDIDPSSHREVIIRCGGPKAVARELNLPTSRVQQMSNRNSIPHWYWEDFVRLARTKGETRVTLIALAALSKMRREIASHSEKMAEGVAA